MSGQLDTERIGEPERRRTGAIVFDSPISHFSDSRLKENGDKGQKRWGRENKYAFALFACPF
jgi:hypothetical protein